MKRDDSVNKAFSFLLAHAKSGKSFTLDDLIKASGWKKSTAKIYLGKKSSELVTKKSGVYYVNPVISRVRLEDFKDLYRQKQRLFTDYVRRPSQKVLVYEFFMPLSREDRLREALDNLFYDDSIRQRISEIGFPKIREGLRLPNTSSDKEVTKLVVQFMDNTIGGYSLHLVSGRFRAGSLATRKDVVSRPFSQGPYLVDETTAVVRFILPVDQDEPSQLSLFEPVKVSNSSDQHVEQMRWLFLNFFAEAVTRVVKKEDEIWLLESGLRSGLYRWVRKGE
jgi:hypothetical protein